MAKVNDALANPTPRFSPIKYSEYVGSLRKTLQEMTHNLNIAKENVADLQKEFDKVSKHLGDTLWLEQMSAKKAFDVVTNNKDEDGEYQNLVDNQMAHDTE